MFHKFSISNVLLSIKQEITILLTLNIHTGDLQQSMKRHRKIIWCSQDEMVIFLGTLGHTIVTQKIIVTICMCLHNYIRDTKLHYEHFDKFERGVCL